MPHHPDADQEFREVCGHGYRQRSHGHDQRRHGRHQRDHGHHQKGQCQHKMFLNKRKGLFFKQLLNHHFKNQENPKQTDGCNFSSFVITPF